MEKSIKHTIKYLLNDRLFSYVAKSIILNNRLDRICRELDSLGFEANIFGSFNLCGSNNEKYNKLLLKRRKGCKRRKDLIKTRDDGYLTAEVGLGSMKASAAPTYLCRGRACKRAATYDSPSNEKIDRTERMESCWNREDSQDTFRSNDLDANFLTETRPNEKKSSDKGSSSSDPVKRLLREQGAIKRSTLKLIIRKARSLDCSCSISLKSIRSCSLSLPCKANDVTKEIFQADPSLYESCLIVMRRKFETGILNLCSCLNDVLKKLSQQMVTDLRLILEIRPGYIHFKLIGNKDNETRSCLFTDRVPICQSVHKRGSDRVIENSIDSNEVSSFNEFYDTFNDTVASEKAKNIDEGNYKKLSFPFYSETNEVERTLDGKVDMGKEQETQLLLDLSVTSRTEKEEGLSTSVARINDDTLVCKKGSEALVETINNESEINCQSKRSVDDSMSCLMMKGNVSSSTARINDDTFMSKKENENVLETVSSKLEINCQCKRSVDDSMSCSMMKENVSSSTARINDDTFMSKKENENVLETVSSKLEINCQCKRNVDDSMSCSMMKENVSSSTARINDDIFMSKKENENVLETANSKLEINCQRRKNIDNSIKCPIMKESVSSPTVQINNDTFVSEKESEVLNSISSKLEINDRCKKSVDDLLICSMMEERFETQEEIKLDLTVECTRCSSCGTPIISSSMDKEINISKSESDILNLMKDLITEIVGKINTTNTTENTVTARSLINEDNSDLIREKNEESFSCACSMSLDSLITRKTFHQEEINSDCDSRCSCRSKVHYSISSFSLERKSNNGFPSSDVLKNEDKFSSSMSNEIEETEASRAKNNTITRLLDISKRDNEPMCLNYEEEKVLYTCKNLVSSSIQTSRTVTSSAFTNAKSFWSEETWMRELQEEKMQKQRKREKLTKIWKSHKKGSSRRRPMQLSPENKQQRSSLPNEKRSICTCNVSKRSGHRGRRRFKDDSWTTRIKKYISFRRSNFLSNSLCNSFYSGRRSIGKLRNLVRAKLRRLMSSDGKTVIDRSKRKFPVYRKTDEIKKSRLIYDVRVESRDDSFESKTFRTIYRKRRNDEKAVSKNSYEFYPIRNLRNFLMEKNSLRIPDKNVIYDLQSRHDEDRYSKDERSITYSYSKIDEKSFLRKDNLIDASSSSQRLVRRRLESGKAREKFTSNEKTFEFVFDKTFWEEITDHSGTVEEYEKSICDLGLNFRSKLEQYVALCKNIKYSLIGNTKENDICYK